MRLLAVISLVLCCFCMDVFSEERITVGDRIVIPSVSKDVRAPRSHSMAVADDGTVLLVWQQGDDYYEMQESDIYGIRMDKEGKLLDKMPFVICSAKQSQFAPKAAFAKGVFMVVWSDFRNERSLNLFAARISLSGKVLEKNGFPLTESRDTQYGVCISGGDPFFIAWSAYMKDIGYKIFAMRVSSEGKPLDGVGVNLNVVGGGPVVTTVGQEWFVVYRMPKNGWQGALLRVGVKEGALAILLHNRSAPTRTGCFGGIASTGDSIFFAGTSVAGRARTRRPLHALSIDPETGKFRKNPYFDTLKVQQINASWRAKTVFTLSRQSPGVDGPIALAAGADCYLMMAKGAASYRKDIKNHKYVNQVHAMLIDTTGKALLPIDQWKPIDGDFKDSCYKPGIVSLGDNAFLVAYLNNNKGKISLAARKLTVSTKVEQ